MAKRPMQHDDGMEIQALKSEMVTLNRRMEEVITILTGSSVYGITGIKSDVKHLKENVEKIQDEIEKMKRDEVDRQKRQGFFSIKLDTIPQKIVGWVAFLSVLLALIQSIRSLFAITAP